MRQVIKLWKRILSYFTGYKGLLALTGGALILMTTTSALMPYILGLAITELGENLLTMAREGLNTGVNYAYIGRVLVGYFALSLLYALGHFGSMALSARVIQAGVGEIREDISKKINRVPVSYFDSHLLGDLLSRVTNDVDTISNALQQGAVNIVINVVSISLTLAMMLVLNWKLTLVILAAIGLVILLGRANTRVSQGYFQSMQNSLGDLFGYTQEQLSGYTEIVAYNQQEESLRGFEDLNREVREASFTSGFMSSLLNPLFSTAFNLAYIVIVLLGGHMTLAGSLTIGNLQAFITYVAQVRGPVNQTSQMIPLVQSSIAAAKRVFEFLDEEEVQDEASLCLPETVKGHVVFDHVKFGYLQDQTLMEDISFEVEPGDMVAIVGPTGAGKTTMINLLMRFYDVTGGAIRIDGVDIRDISRQDLRSHMGMVLQDAWLYKGTVMENIRFGKLDATDYEVREAAKTANVHDFIQTLPGGYNMVIGEDGANISQGQKQLMTIARALISDPDILILDEATSSVDTRLEALIQDAMARVMEGRTSFVIAHRLSTIRDADKILVMKDGDIIETGTHEDLLEAGGFYADLYMSQFSDYDKTSAIHMEY